MRRCLAALAAWVVDHHKLVLAAWLVAIAVAIPFAARLHSVLDKQGASKLVAGTESAEVERLVQTSFTHGSERDTYVVVSARDVRAPAVGRLLGRLESALPSPGTRRLVAPSRRVAVLVARMPESAAADVAVPSLRRRARTLVRALGLTDSVRVHVTGELALIQDTYAKAEGDSRLMESAAYLVILVVLLAFFRAVVPTVLTIAAIGLAMNVSQAGLYVLGHHVALTQFTLTIMTFVMLGAGVDYSMLLSSRYRQERLAGRSERDAVIRATVHAGESVVLAGAAVMLAFGSTLLSPVEWIPPLGFGGLVGIPIILLAALTLTPSLLAWMGDRFFALGRGALADFEHGGGLAQRLRALAGLSQRRPLRVILVFAIVSIPLASVAVTRHLTADPVALSPATDSQRGFELLAGTWGKGALFPTTVVGRTVGGTQELDQLTRQITAVDGVARVERDAAARGDLTRWQVTLRDDPFSPAAADTVRRIERVVDAAQPRLLVGGATREDGEYAQALRTSLWQMVVLISLGILAVLLVALRSLLVPLRLIATIMLSNVWAVGLTVLVFSVWLDEPVINDLPIFLVMLMMGLGMDYEIFLVTRVRELRRRGMSDERAITGAVVDTGRVITAAGLVMAGCLGAMALSSTVMLREYGVGLGVAVLLDATLVRLLLVPATLAVFGRYNWWLPCVSQRASGG